MFTNSSMILSNNIQEKITDRLMRRNSGTGKVMLGPRPLTVYRQIYASQVSQLVNFNVVYLSIIKEVFTLTHNASNVLYFILPRHSRPDSLPHFSYLIVSCWAIELAVLYQL